MTTDAMRSLGVEPEQVREILLKAIEETPTANGPADA
jgi:hypothetical protein